MLLLLFLVLLLLQVLLLVTLAPLLALLLLQLLTELGIDEIAIVLVVFATAMQLLVALPRCLSLALPRLQLLGVIGALLGDGLDGGHIAGRRRGRVGGASATNGGMQKRIVATEIQLVVGAVVAVLCGHHGRINGQLLMVDGNMRLRMVWAVADAVDRIVSGFDVDDGQRRMRGRTAAERRLTGLWTAVVRN